MPASVNIKLHCSVAERFRDFLGLDGKNSMRIVRCEAYRRSLAGEEPMTAREMFVCGHFWHGRALALAIEQAEKDGELVRVRSDPPDSHRTAWHPTDKLISSMRQAIDDEIAAWKRLLV